MISIFLKDVNDFLNSLIAYIVIGVFLVAVSLVIWVFPDTSILEYGYASMEPLFSIGPYLFLFLIPAVTMKSFAEERRSGTLELLYTLPFRNWEIIGGKFLASYSLVIFSILPTVIYYFSISELGLPKGNLDTPGIIGSYIGLLFLAGVFTAFGIFSSALTGNQIVAFVLSAFLCFLFYEGFETLSSIDVWGSWSYYFSQIGILSHYNSLSKGVIDLRDVGYFIALKGVVVFSIHFILESKK